MSVPPGDLRLRMELLRLRGQLQRADAAAALDEVRVRSQGLRALLAAGLSLADASRSGAGWATMLTSGLRERPWLLGLGMVALRAARRHPLAAATAAGVAVALWRLLRPSSPQAPGSPARDADPMVD